MWYDNWHPVSPLIEHFGEMILDDSNLALDAKLESIIQGGSWNWPSASSDLILELISNTPTALIPSVIIVLCGLSPAQSLFLLAQLGSYGDLKTKKFVVE